MQDFKDLFLKTCEKPVLDVVKTFLHEGFIVSLVGGGVRELLLEKRLPTDLDFELRSVDKITDHLWIDKIKRFAKKLKEDSYQVECLPYNIIRIVMRSSILEFAPARIELFHEQDNCSGHKDFVTSFVSDVPYTQSVLRRDFSINAIYLEIISDKNDYLDVKLIDPLNGLVDLQNKNLRACGKNFYKDPVRFVRMIRFMIQYDFSLDDDLLETIALFNLEKLSKYYFIKESFKVPFFKFVKLFFKMVNEYNIFISEDFKEIAFLKEVSNFDKIRMNPVEILAFLVFNDVLVEKSDIESFVSFFSVKKNIYMAMINYRTSFDRYLQIDFDKVSILIQSSLFEEVIYFKEMDIIKRLISSRKKMQLYVKDCCWMWMMPDEGKMSYKIYQELTCIDLEGFDNDLVEKRPIARKDYWRVSIYLMLQRVLANHCHGKKLPE